MASHMKELEEHAVSTDSISVPEHPQASTSGVNTTDDCSSDTATAQDLMKQMDDELLKGILNGEEDSIHKFFISLKLTTDKNAVSERFDYVVQQVASEFLTVKSDLKKATDKLKVSLKREKECEEKIVQHLKNIRDKKMAQMNSNIHDEPIIHSSTDGLQDNSNPRLKLKHPAPLPTPLQRNTSGKRFPPAPSLTLKKQLTKDGQGLVLSWTVNNSSKTCAKIKRYEIFIYHEEATVAPSTDTWKKISDVKALPLPMSCTLAQFIPGEKYHFVIRAIDMHNRYGPFSSPECQFMD